MITEKMTLREFVVYYTVPVPLAQIEADVDMIFFKVNVVNEPDRDLFMRLVANFNGVFSYQKLNLLDGKVYVLDEISKYLGETEIALRMIALGAHLNVWRFISPRDLKGIDDATVMAVAKTGLIGIIVEPVV